LHQVRFTEGVSYVNDYELELVDGEGDVYELLENGRYGRLNDLRRNLTHIQLTGKLANLVYSMDTTNTSFYAYQFKPVLSFLDSPSNGLLIADEVGLGKTIEAGLIWTELRARYDARRLLVVCPAVLREKWKDELATRFSIQAQIMDAGELLKELQKGKEEVADGRALICSLQSIRPPSGWREQEGAGGAAARLARMLDSEAESEPLIDLVVIDESHYLRNPDTQSAMLGRLLREVTDYMVLLSATPVNLKEEDLFHQLNLVDPDFFGHDGSFSQVLQANEPLLRAREYALNRQGTAAQINKCLQSARRHEMLSENGQLAALLDGGVTEASLATTESRIRLANRIERINMLSHAVSRTRKRDVQELRVIREPKDYFVAMSEEEKRVYDLVTRAIIDYAIEENISSGFLLAEPQRRVSSCIYAAVKSWQSDWQMSHDQTYEDFGFDVPDQDDSDDRPLRRRLIDKVIPEVNLDALLENDTKYHIFSEAVTNYLRDNPDEKMVVFSYYPGTLEYLSRRLHDDGVSSVVLHGSVKRPKDEIISRFRDDGQCRLLLSSEVASEGVDLQFCRVLINYDLPWNPMKVEQRIGRIDRLGQEAEKISILNLGHADTIDHRIYSKLMLRLKIFTKALGGMESVLGEQIKELASDLFSRQLTSAQQEERIEQSAKAIEQIRQQQDELESQASHMIAHGGYILEQVQAAHDFKKRITSEDLMVYAVDYLNRYVKGHTFRQVGNDKNLFEIQLPQSTAASLDNFMQSRRLYDQTQLATGNLRRCRFRNKLERLSREEETISQFHPLIRFISEDLRSRDEVYYPLVATSLVGDNAGEGVAQGAYVFSVKRWSFSGLKQEEQLQARVVRLSDDQVLGADQSLDLLNRVKVMGNDWLAAKNELASKRVGSAMDLCGDVLEEDFEEAAHARKLENEDRVNFQIQAARLHRDRQLMREKETLRKYQESGRVRLIPAMAGKIRKVNERFENKEAKLKEKLKFHYSPFDVCYGVIDVR